MPPLVSNAQAMRAILLARATATTLTVCGQEAPSATDTSPAVAARVSIPRGLRPPECASDIGHPVLRSARVSVCRQLNLRAAPAQSRLPNHDRIEKPSDPGRLLRSRWLR